MGCHVPAHAAFISMYNLILKNRASYTFMYMFIGSGCLLLYCLSLPTCYVVFLFLFYIIARHVIT